MKMKLKVTIEAYHAFDIFYDSHVNEYTSDLYETSETKLL